MSDLPLRPVRQIDHASFTPSIVENIWSNPAFHKVPLPTSKDTNTVSYDLCCIGENATLHQYRLKLQASHKIGQPLQMNAVRSANAFPTPFKSPAAPIQGAPNGPTLFNKITTISQHHSNTLDKPSVSLKRMPEPPGNLPRSFDSAQKCNGSDLGHIPVLSLSPLLQFTREDGDKPEKPFRISPGFQKNQLAKNDWKPALRVTTKINHIVSPRQCTIQN